MVKGIPQPASAVRHGVLKPLVGPGQAPALHHHLEASLPASPGVVQGPRDSQCGERGSGWPLPWGSVPGREVSVSGSWSPCLLFLPALSSWVPRLVCAPPCSTQEMPGAPGSLSEASAHHRCTLLACSAPGSGHTHPSAWGQEDTYGSGDEAHACIWPGFEARPHSGSVCT